MRHHPTLQEFVDEELLRAPLAMDLIIDAVIDQWRRTTPAASKLSVDPVRVLTQHRSELVAEAVGELRNRAMAELGGTLPSRGVTRPAPMMELALIGEDEVSVDVEVARAVEQVKAAAEFELRELQAFTSALADDVNVSRDTNPFRPESFVRSLWVGVATLPLSRSLQAAFMRDAAVPMGRTLRQAYAAACTRLESQGVEPAVYRTIVQTGVLRSGLDPLHSATAPETSQLGDLLDSMPMSPDLSPTGHSPGLERPAAAPKRVDPQLVELITRLFDAIQSSSRLPSAAMQLVMRLQPAAMRAALRDPSMMDSYSHPVWRFMDQVGFLIEVTPAADLERCLAYCRQLVEHLVADDSNNLARFEWGTGRLLAFDKHLLDQGIAAAAGDIAHIRERIDTAHQPIDVATMDTIPAALLPEPSAAKPPPLAMQPGDRLRAYLHGEWRLLQLLWCDNQADHWLLRDITNGQTWVLRQRALDRLVAEQLARPYRLRSLVRDAAHRVLQRLNQHQTGH